MACANHVSSLLWQDTDPWRSGMHTLIHRSDNIQTTPHLHSCVARSTRSSLLMTKSVWPGTKRPFHWTTRKSAHSSIFLRFGFGFARPSGLSAVVCSLLCLVSKEELLPILLRMQSVQVKQAIQRAACEFLCRAVQPSLLAFCSTHQFTS